ncbi:leucine-rich repeat-containing protein 27 [Larimichthys crocea]|uniref:leucine-rich repeat-containing protein 27 n=1 Tax=Larimichthys crocea TaxID=215358 RepID=UPI000900D520|nr:leucine-rich repeat-containing protein 27 [Larimichthys crocea]
MSSPEKEEEEQAPGQQLSLVLRDSVVKPLAPLIPPEDAEPQQLPKNYSTDILSLSRTKLQHVPESVLRNSSVKYLYLEGNQIPSIPGSLFVSLPNLQWLDLRHNQIASLPAKIGLHRSLKTLLLEGNPISELPPELGNVITLNGLLLRDCPISFPPRDIVNQGVQGILQYLRTVLANRPVSTRKTTPELPEVEKLQLSELMGSSMEEQDDSVDEQELQRFRELKNKMILLDNAELDSASQSDRNPKSALLPVIKSKKATTKAGIIPELPLLVSTWRSPEERRKEKQALLEQRKKSQETLQKWRTQAKITQRKKFSEGKQKEHERQRKREEAETNSKSGVEDSSDSPRIQTPDKFITEWQDDKSSYKLVRQISALCEKMQERRRNPRGATTEQMASAEKDVAEMRKLQTRLLEKRRLWGHDPEMSSYAEDTWQSFLEK